MAYKLKKAKLKESKERDSRINNYFSFNDEVKNELIPYAEKKGWKLDEDSDEPKFVKGKGEVYMHTDDAVIFATINDKFGDESGGKTYAKHYKQDMNLFSGNYKPNRVKKYIQQGKASINQVDKKL